MKTIHDDAETIRRRMALIRRKHHEDVRAVLAGAEKVAGWGRHVRLYTWVALGVAAGFWMVTHRRRTVPIKSATGEIVAKTADKTEPTEVAVAKRSTTFSSLLGGAASFLTTVAIRAAQNYAACCLEECLAPPRLPKSSKTGPVPASDDYTEPDGRRSRIERVNGNHEKIESVLFVGGSKDGDF